MALTALLGLAVSAAGTVSCLCCQLPWKAGSVGKVLTAVFFFMMIILNKLITLGMSGLTKGIKIPELGSLADAPTIPLPPDVKEYFTAMRVYSVLFFYHLGLCLALIGVDQPNDSRAILHYGVWPIKGLILFFGALLSPLFPISLYYYSYQICLLGATIFIVVQAVLLIDLSCNISEALVSKYEETEGTIYQVGLLGITIVCYILFFVVAVVLWNYRPGDQDRALNAANLIICLAMSIISMNERVQDANPNASILSASMLCLFNVFLLLVALVSKNPTETSSSSSGSIGGSTGTDTSQKTPAWVQLIIGIVRYFFAFGVIGYLSFSNIELADLIDGVEEKSEADKQATLNVVLNTTTTPAAGATTTDATATPAGSAEKTPAAASDVVVVPSATTFSPLPAPAPPAPSTTMTTTTIKVNTAKPVVSASLTNLQDSDFSYSMIHGLFALGACFFAISVKDWQRVDIVINRATHSDGTHYDNPVYSMTGSESAYWFMIVASWVQSGLFIWTLIAPLIMADRAFDAY